MRAAVAIGHKILVTAYRMLITDSDYEELGDGYLDQLKTHRSAGNMLRRLRQMGYDVQISTEGGLTVWQPYRPRPPKLFSW